MDYFVILKVDFDGKNKLVRVNESTSFQELFAEITRMCPLMSGGNLSISYSVGSINNCCLESDSDLVGMVEFCKITSEKIVNVSVHLVNQNIVLSEMDESADMNDCLRDQLHKKTESLQNNMSNFSEKSNYNNSVSTYLPNNQFQRDFEGMGSIPSFEVCPIEKKKTYLSDHWANIMEGGVGTVFAGGAPEFRSELIKYSTKLNFKYKYLKNSPRYVYAVCNERDSCEWFIKAKRLPMNTGFVVAKANLVHNCVGNLLIEDKNRLGPKIIKELVMETVKANPTIPVKEVVDLINQGYGFVLPYWKTWRGIEAARNDIFGSYDESYDQLRWYCDAVKRTNPGSIVDLEKNNITNCFERIFVSFNASKEGFKNCRPMLFIDGTFMKGRSKGVLLAATAKDGNNGLFPVAFAVVSAENRNNWAWFLTKLRDLIIHEKKIIYISDRNTGLMSAFYDVWDDPAHFYCLYHLLLNLRGKYGGGWNTQHRDNMADLFKQCAYAPTSTVFKEKLQKFKAVGGQIAEQWLEDMPYKRWAVAYSPHIKRYGEMTSNAAESFNSWIREARTLPITYMLDSIRKKISKWFVDRRDKSNKWTGLLVPSKEDLWNELGNISASWGVSRYPNGQFEVRSRRSVTVDLEDKICTCFQWQIQGFPCAHAVAVIKKHCDSIFNYVEECFFTSRYKQCYEEDLVPVPETERFECNPELNLVKILPPALNKAPGRPKQKRITSYGEFRKVKPKVCKRCGKTGRHDSLTCATVFGTDKTNLQQ